MSTFEKEQTQAVKKATDAATKYNDFLPTVRKWKIADYRFELLR